MKNQIKKAVLFGLVAAGLVALPAASRAGENSKTNALEQTTPGPKPTGSRRPFHGTIATVDSAAMTLTVASLTLNVTSETKITKGGKPATLSEIAAGDTVSGSYRKDDAGKLNAAIIRAMEKAPKPEKKLKPEPAIVK